MLLSHAAPSTPPAGGSSRAKPPARTSVSSLKLNNFRNYETLSLTLDARPVVILGANGAGKTNLLEAVSFLSPGRGFRRASLDSVARRGSDAAWAIAATIQTRDGEIALGTGLAADTDGERSRAIRINHAPAKSSESLLECLRVVWLTPAADGLFTGPASDRRRFLDRLTLAIDRGHGGRVASFERAMRGRNRLLDQGGGDRIWLDAIEAQMAELGVAIAAARRECVALLTASVEAAGPRGRSFPQAILSLEGSLEAAIGAGAASEAEDGYRADLARGRSNDRAAGRTLVGPHLTDLSVTHAGKAMVAASCSTGEQKALLIGITLAHADLVAGLTGETPLVLLDEIAAHLDEERRAALFAFIEESNCQAWMTGTDAFAFAPLAERAQCLRIADGRAERRERVA
ncbi:MAG: DNA replication/repair protein RecF [Bauldia sp.]